VSEARGILRAVPTLCLVATPLAGSRAARRLCDAQDGILFGPAVSTIERLASALVAAAGDRRPILPPLAERLLAAEAGETAGGALAGLSPRSGVARALARTLAELRRGEVSAEDVRGAAAELGGAPAARLATMARALEAYEGRLAVLGALDRAGAVRVAAEAARRGVVAPESAGLDLLVVDGIASLAPAEWDLVSALAERARRTRVHLPFWPERPDVSAPAEALLRRLEALHELSARRDVEVVLPHVDDGRAPRIAAALHAMGGGRAVVRAGDGGLVLAAAGAGEAGEPAAAAAVVARLLEEGLAPEEIAIVSPAPRRHAGGLARALADLGIPFAAGRGEPLDEVPVVRLVEGALAAAGALDRSAAERLLGSTWLAPRRLPGLRALLDRSGALDGRVAPADALRARAAALGGAAARERTELLRAADAVDALDARLRPLASPAPARVHAARLAGLVEGTGLRRRAARGPADVARRDLAALARLDDAAEAVARAVALAGRADAALSAAAFRALLALAVEEGALPPPPEPAAGAVELWGLDEAPGIVARGVVVVGAARGALPAAAPPEPLLRDPERLAVNRRLRRAALPVAAARRADALHRVFAAAAAARDALAFVWPAAGPGGGGGPLAPLVVEALVGAGVAQPSGVAPEPGLGSARTPRAALRAAARAGAGALPALAATTLGDRAGDVLARGAVDAGRREAVLEGRAAPAAGAISGAAAAALRAALPEEWAPTRLEAYARCPFRALLQLALRLPDADAADLEIGPRDEGTVVHAALERFVRGRMARGVWPPTGGREDLEQARAAADAVFAEFERRGRTGDPAVWAARREAVRARLERMVLADARDHDGLVPVAVEHRFGRGGAAPSVALTANGETVRLEGRIDRIDAAPGRLLVLDYKNARSGAAYGDALEPEAFGETSFQIPAYLLAAAQAFPGRTRLEAAFALVRRGERTDTVVMDAGEPSLVTGVGEDAARRADGDGDGVGVRAAALPTTPGRTFAAAVIDTVRRIRSGDFPIRSRDCTGCAFGAVCRFEGTAERRAEAAP
jgi:RecB family exonuclease